MKKRILPFALVLIILAVVLFVILPHVRREKQYARAVEDLQAGRYAEAAEGFSGLVWENGGYKDANQQRTLAREGLAAQAEADGNWEKAMEVYASMTAYNLLRRKNTMSHSAEYANAAVQRAAALGQEGKADEAVAFLDGILNDPPEGFSDSYNTTLTAGKAQVLMAAERYEEAGAVYRELTESVLTRDRYLPLYTECLYRHAQYEQEHGNPEEAEALMRSAVSLYAAGNEYEPLREVILAEARQLIAEENWTEAAEETYRLSIRYGKTAELKKEIAALKQQVIDGFVAAHAWEDFYQSRYQDDFDRLARQDAALAKIHHLVSTGRSEMAETETDFEALMASRPEAEQDQLGVMFRELYYADGDPAQQLSKARAYARERGMEMEFLRMGMDIAAGAVIAGVTTYPMREEVRALLAAVENPRATGGALAEKVFLRDYGLIADFRAEEPRPGYFTIVTAQGSELTTYASGEGKAIMEGLAKKGTETFDYQAVSNPQTASLLLVLDSSFERGGTYQLTTVTRQELELLPPGVPLPGKRETQSYTGYIQTVGYQLWDCVSGGMIASGSVKATSNLSDRQTIASDLRDDRAKTFKIRCSSAALSGASEGAQALYEATRRYIVDFCAR